MNDDFSKIQQAIDNQSPTEEVFECGYCKKPIPEEFFWCDTCFKTKSQAELIAKMFSCVIEFTDRMMLEAALEEYQQRLREKLCKRCEAEIIS